MLNKQQFLFDSTKYDVPSDQMNFEQFTRTATHFHAQYASNPDNPYGDSLSYDRRVTNAAAHHEENIYPDSTLHAGTLRAAQDRIRDLSGGGVREGHGVIFPLHHRGPVEHTVRADVGDLWGVEEARAHNTGKTIEYINRVEDPGSISILAPRRNVQTYGQYVESIPEARRTERQQLEYSHGREAYGHGRSSEMLVDQPSMFYDMGNTWSDSVYKNHDARMAKVRATAKRLRQSGREVEDVE